MIRTVLALQTLIGYCVLAILVIAIGFKFVVGLIIGSGVLLAAIVAYDAIKYRGYVHAED